MRKYLILSIPIVIAFVVGFVAYQVKLMALDPPTEEQIQNAPDDAESTEGEDFFKDWEKEWEAKQKGKKLSPKAGEPVDKKPSKGRLRVERKNAYITARQTGAKAGMIALGICYALLGASMVYRSRLKAGNPWHDGFSASADDDDTGVTLDDEAGYDEQEDSDAHTL